MRDYKPNFSFIRGIIFGRISLMPFLNTNTPTFDAKIMNSEKVLYEGKAKSASSVNDTDKFDILPGHTNFISIIKDYLILVTETGEELKFDVENGIVMVFQNKLKVFLGIKQQKVATHLIDDEKTGPADGSNE